MDKAGRAEGDPTTVNLTQAKARPRKPLPLKELDGFRAAMPRLRRPTAELLREVRDEAL